MSTSLKGIQNRLKALEKTASITDAMHNISISKVKGLTKSFENYQVFKKRFSEILKVATDQIPSHILIDQGHYEKQLFIVISSDRGLVGGYHNQLFKQFYTYVKDLDKAKYQVLVIGKKGHSFMKRYKMPLVNQSVIVNRDDISILTFVDKLKVIYSTFMARKIDRITIFYNHYLNAASQTVVHEQILPIECEAKANQYRPYDYETNPIDMLERIAMMHLETHIYGALVDAKLSEHAARLIAMKAATDNAKNIGKKLKIEYHRVRQQSITNELIDIVNGTLS